jgi:hypothetical protein
VIVMNPIQHIRRFAGRAGRPAALAGLPGILPTAAAAAPPDPPGGASMSAGTGHALGPLSFRRIVDIPFETCVAALESWQRTGPNGGQQIGPSRLRGPIEHDRDSGTCRIQVRLARGPLRPLLRMRLDIDHRSSWPASTALELIPCQRIRPAATYFRAGHLLLDSLTRSLPQHAPAQRLDRLTASQPPAHHGEPRPAGEPQTAGQAPDRTANYARGKECQPVDHGGHPERRFTRRLLLPPVAAVGDSLRLRGNGCRLRRGVWLSYPAVPVPVPPPYGGAVAQGPGRPAGSP